MLWLLKKNRKLSLSSRDRGFTLIEVLVVVIMVGILSAISAPAWLGFINNQRLNTAQSRIFSTLKDAQSSAKRSGVVTTFTIANDSAKGSYVKVGNAQSQYLEQNVQILSVVKNSTTTSLPLEIQFNAQGFPVLAPTDLPLKITINSSNSPDRKRCISIMTILGALKTRSDAECN